jgi:adenylate cyclase
MVGSIMAHSKGIGEFRGENYAIHAALTKLDSMVQQTKKALESKRTLSSDENNTSNHHQVLTNDITIILLSTDPFSSSKKREFLLSFMHIEILSFSFRQST